MYRRVEFIGRSRDDLRSFPESAQELAGRQLQFVQYGALPADWKPMRSIGPAVNEIRIHDATGAYRVIYVAKFDEAIYVLHCFEKKSQKTSRADLALASARYRSVLAGRLRGPRTI
jgi:phage-related protein